MPKPDKLVPTLRKGKLKLVDKQIVAWRRLKRNQRKYTNLIKQKLTNIFHGDIDKVDEFLSTWNPDLEATPYTLINDMQAFKVWVFVRYKMIYRDLRGTPPPPTE